MNRNKDWRYSCSYFSCLLKKKCWCLCFPGCKSVCKMPGACDEIWRQTVVHWLQKCARNVAVCLSVWEIQTFTLSLSCRPGTVHGCARHQGALVQHMIICRVHLKYDGTQWRTGEKVKGKLANAVSIQYSSHYLGTWCIQHYYRWCARLGCQ